MHAEEDRVLLAAILVAIGLGIVATFFFLYIGQDSFSVISIAPDSISHTTIDEPVFFTYEVKCLERGGAEYSLDFFCGDTLVNTKHFTLKKGDTLEERTKLELPKSTTLPVKISLVLNTGEKTEEVHFWFK